MSTLHDCDLSEGGRCATDANDKGAVVAPNYVKSINSVLGYRQVESDECNLLLFCSKAQTTVRVIYAIVFLADSA